MKKANIKRNQLKLILIFNDFYEILCYFRQPFFKLGNRTAQQITNLPIFLSFFVMSLSIIQICFDTHSFSIIKNYPLFVNLTNKKIPQKFETLYLQLLETKEITKSQFEERKRGEPPGNTPQIRKKIEIQKGACAPPGGAPRARLPHTALALSGSSGEPQARGLRSKDEIYKNQDQMNFYKPEYPIVFHQIRNSKQKQNTINLYKTFEQIGPILLSEIKKEKNKKLFVEENNTALNTPFNTHPEDIIHLGVDIPYQNWSSNTKNFNITEDKLLTNWQFNDSDLRIKDLKKDKHLDKSYRIIQQFILQYKNYVKEIENKKYIYLKNKVLPFQKIYLTENSDKIIINLKSAFKSINSFKTRFKDALPDLLLDPKNPWGAQARCAASLAQGSLADASSQRRARGTQARCAASVPLLRKQQAWGHGEHKHGVHKRLASLLGAFPNSPLGHKLCATSGTNTSLSTQSSINNKFVVLNHNPNIFKNKMDKFLNSVSQGSLLLRLQAAKAASSPIEEKFQKFQFHPRVNPIDIFYQIQEIEDQIPTKIQGISTDHLVNKKYLIKKDFLFGDNQYQEREYEIITYDKKVWDTLHNHLSQLQVQMPSFMEFVHQHPKGSLLNIKFISQEEEPLTNLLKFLELTKTKILKHLTFIRKFEKYQLKELQYFGQFDLEIAENNKNFNNIFYCYSFPMKFNTQTKKIGIRTNSFAEKSWLIPKPKYLYINDFEFFYGIPSRSGELFYPKKTIGDRHLTFDNYIKKPSFLLQLQEENPYFYLDEIISPEDYLLETLFVFIKQNLTQYEQKESSDLTKAKIKKKNRNNLKEIEKKLKEIEKKLLDKSTPSRKIFHYLNNRKKQRALALKNSGQFLQIKNLLEKKRKIQRSFVYDSILNDYLFDPRIFELQKNYIKDVFSSVERKMSTKSTRFYPCWASRKLPSEVNSTSLWHQISHWILVKTPSPKGKDNNKFWNDFQKLLRINYQKEFFIKLINKYFSFLTTIGFDKTNSEKTINFVHSLTKKHPILLNLYEVKDNLKFQWIWYQVQKNENPEVRKISKAGQNAGSAKPNTIKKYYHIKKKDIIHQYLKFLEIKINLRRYLNKKSFKERNNEKEKKVAILSPFSLRKIKFYSCWVNFLKSYNENTPYECRGKYYFVRKLPKIPKNVDHPIIAIKKTRSSKQKKDAFPYRVINLQIMTPFKKKKIEYGKKILLNLPKFNEPKKFNSYDQFFSILDKLAEENSKEMNDPNIYPKGFDEENRTIEILDDFDNYLKDNDSKRTSIGKYLGQKQPIYQNTLSRQMSGYSFPDLKRKQLSRLLASFNQRTQSLELEIPISNINLNVYDFLKQLPELQIQRFKNSLNISFQIFKHQPKISQKSFWDSQFFEFRENFNSYSWSILFFLSSGWLFVNLFKNLYKKYAKEFVESGIDFLKRAGILDDVQWIKEELGMAPIDKGYRGIRHPGRKKLKNIIGLERKPIISQVGEMVLFLKTKKLMNSFDPFVQILLFINHNYDFLVTKTTKIHLMEKLLTKARLATIAPKLRVRKISPRYVIVQENLRILFPELAKPKVEISPQQKETLCPFRFRVETVETNNAQEEEEDARPKVKNDISLALKRNRNPIKPKGFLFTGPPGTGKTLLVQAIAGETSVPVVTQSGGLLQNPRKRGQGATTLHKLFLRAREIAPCIIFIDEIDGIGTRRQFLPLYIDIYGRYDPIEWLESEGARGASPPKIYQTKLQRRAEFLDDHDPYWKEPEFTQTVQSPRIPIDVLQDLQFSRGARSEQLSILTQLLIELDGLHALENILVIGATNRLEILDPALMRPGRFQRILRFNLPDYQARINLLKLYTSASKIGMEKISWDYFSKRTHGLSSADIASIVFASELTAIQQSKTHTFETLERGIDLITSFPSDPVMYRLKNIFIFLENIIDKFFSKNFFYSTAKTQKWEKTYISPSYLQETSNIYRNCYYNIGKLVVLFCLQIMSSAYISLWVRPKNFRFFFFTKNFNEFDEFDQKMFSRKEIEKRLLAFFGGKAAESLFIFLPLHKFSSEIYFHFDQTFLSINNSLEQSNFGIDNEIQTAQNLLKLMVEKWYFYLERIATEKFHPILENANLWEYSEKEIFLNQALVDEMIIDLDMRNRLSKNEQKYSYQTWWMKKVATQLNYRAPLTALYWSRIYLSDPEDSPQNIEWVAPDEYFHTLFRIPPNCMAWSHFLENGRFAISNLLLLQSFNIVFKTLRQFSEFMDFLADYFLRYECIREMEFQTKISQFFYYVLQEL